MEKSKVLETAKKKRLSVSVSCENYALLNWLKVNFSDSYSIIVNKCLDKYREEFTEGMTDFEKEQIQQIKLLLEQGIMNKKELSEAKEKAFENLRIIEMDQILIDPDKRAKLKEIIKFYE